MGQITYKPASRLGVIRIMPMPWGPPRPYFLCNLDVFAIGHTDMCASIEVRLDLMASCKRLSSLMRTVWSSLMHHTRSFRVHTIWGIRQRRDIINLFCMRQAPHHIKKRCLRMHQSLTQLMMVAAHGDATMQSLTMLCITCILYGS